MSRKALLFNGTQLLLDQRTLFDTPAPVYSAPEAEGCEKGYVALPGIGGRVFCVLPEHREAFEEPLSALRALWGNELARERRTTDSERARVERDRDEWIARANHYFALWSQMMHGTEDDAQVASDMGAVAAFRQGAFWMKHLTSEEGGNLTIRGALGVLNGREEEALSLGWQRRGEFEVGD